MMISLAIALVAILGLRQLFQFQNQQRDRQKNVKIHPESCEESEIEKVVALGIALDQDVTDWDQSINQSKFNWPVAV
jgi:hypothetical protein